MGVAPALVKPPETKRTLVSSDPFVLTLRWYEVLKTIEELSSGNADVAPRDIESKCGVSRSVVSRTLGKLRKRGVIVSNGESTIKIRYRLSDECLRRGFVLSERPLSGEHRPSGNDSKTDSASRQPSVAKTRTRVPRPSVEEQMRRFEEDQRAFVAKIDGEIEEAMEFLERKGGTEHNLSSGQKTKIEQYKHDLAEAEDEDSVKSKEFREVYFMCKARILEIGSANNVPRRLRQIISDLERQIAEAKERHERKVMEVSEKLASLKRMRQRALNLV